MAHKNKPEKLDIFNTESKPLLNWSNRPSGIIHITWKTEVSIFFSRKSDWNWESISSLPKARALVWGWPQRGSDLSWRQRNEEHGASPPAGRSVIAAVMIHGTGLEHKQVFELRERHHGKSFAEAGGNLLTGNVEKAPVFNPPLH